MAEFERKTVRLGRAGGSSTVVLPKQWLEELGVDDRVDLLRTEEGILIAPHGEPARSIEDEPEFALFLDFLMRSALAHGPDLVEAATLMAGDDELFDGVERDITDDNGAPLAMSGRS